MDIVLSSVAQGLLWSIMAIGVYLTYRLLDIADLTAEGSYPLGAAICATGIVHGLSPMVATLLGFLGGVIAGFVSGFLHTKLKIPALLAGIVTLTGLYSVNLKILGKANVALLRQPTLVKDFQEWGLEKVEAVLLIGCLFVVVIILLLSLLIRTQLGLAFVATGDNIPMSEANGIDVDRMKRYGYMLSNGFIALCGALLTQNNGYADITSGTGTIVIGLASIIIAEVLVKHSSFGKRLVSIVFGSILYRLILLAILEIPRMGALVLGIGTALIAYALLSEKRQRRGVLVSSLIGGGMVYALVAKLLPEMDADLVKLFSAVLLAVVLFVPEVQKKITIRPLQVRKT